LFLAAKRCILKKRHCPVCGDVSFTKFGTLPKKQQGCMYTTRTTVLKNIAAGNEVAWNDLYVIYHPLILSCAMKRGVPVADVDDIIQQVMLALFNNGKFIYSRQKHGLFRSYLGGIIRHKIYDYFRKQPATPGPGANEECDDSFEKNFLAEYRTYVIKEALGELKHHVRPEIFETFYLCCMQNRPDKEVAEIQQILPNTVTARKKRCREIMKNIIEELNFSDPELNIPLL